MPRAERPRSGPPPPGRGRRAPPPPRRRWSRGGRAPHVEEVEPLGRAPAYDPLEGGYPRASRLFLATSRNGQRLRHRHGVPVALIEHAERGDEWHPDGTGEDEWPERERRGRSKEGEEDVAARAERPVPLHGDHLPAPERRHQLQGDGRARPGHEAHALAVTPNPAPEVEGLVLGHDHVRGPVRAAREKTTGQ